MRQQTLEELIGPESADCPTCGRSFDTERGMRIHHSKSHDESLSQRRDVFRCRCCEADLPTKRGLTSHLAQVHPEYWCELQEEGITFTIFEQ